MRLLAVILGLAGAALAQSQNVISADGLGRSNPGPAFDHGYVAAWDLLQVHSLTLYDPTGARLFDLTSLTLPDGTKTYTPESVDIDSDGVSAHAWRVSGSLRSGFALLDKAGNQLRVVETQPYSPSQVCFAPDHSIWMFGQLWNSKSLEDDYPVFRHYSRDGKLLGSFVSRSLLPPYEGAGSDGALGGFIGLWRLRASKDRIGAALLLSGGYKQAWVELDFDGHLLGQWTFSSVMPLAFDENDVLYGGHWTGRHQYNLLVFDKSSSTWKPLPPHPSGLLLGADGTRLVYQDGDELRWVDPPAPPTESASVTQP